MLGEVRVRILTFEEEYCIGNVWSLAAPLDWTLILQSSVHDALFTILLAGKRKASE
jgi:hypothetical protein